MLRQVLLVAGGASLLFGLLFLGLYRDRLERERAATSNQINHVLRLALENAMLKRDVPGLREIVERIGRQQGIRDVMILAPSGEVRFAAHPESLGSSGLNWFVSNGSAAGKPVFAPERGQGRGAAFHQSGPQSDGLYRLSRSNSTNTR